MSANISQYKDAFCLSQAVIDAMEIDEFPISMLRVFDRKELAQRILVSSFQSYKEWALAAGLPCPDELKDAKCYYHPSSNIYIIVYNEKKPSNRTRFSLAHELGHIALHHLDDERTEICRGGLDDVTYYAMEGAANTFAGNFLAPPILIRERIDNGKFNVTDIARFFRLSEPAVKTYRQQDYKYWLKMTPSRHEINILDRCKDKLFPKFCRTCKAITYQKGARHCICCGAALKGSQNARGVKVMIYPSLTLREDGRVQECPNCKNEEHIAGADFCMICGSPAVNICTFAHAENVPYEYNQCSHTEPLPGNARFCPYCGNKTVFFEAGILKAWNHEEPGFAELSDDDGNLPF